MWGYWRSKGMNSSPDLSRPPNVSSYSGTQIQPGQSNHLTPFTTKPNLGHTPFQEKGTYCIFAQRTSKPDRGPRRGARPTPPAPLPYRGGAPPLSRKVGSWPGVGTLQKPGGAGRGAGQRQERAPFCAAPGTCPIGSVGAAVGVGGASLRRLGAQSSPGAAADGAHLAAGGRVLGALRRAELLGAAPPGVWALL